MDLFLCPPPQKKKKNSNTRSLHDKLLGLDKECVYNSPT